jgi:outer membrane protein OmpA-like peptidoglycan-associated protein
MRPLPKPRAVSLIAATLTPFAAILAAGVAYAQVTVDLHALQALPEHPAAGKAISRPASAPASAPAATAKLATSAKPAAPPAVTPGTPQPALPEGVPDTASINPVAPVEPPAGTAPPPPPPVSDKAATTVEATTLGLRLIFNAEQSDLNPDSVGSIKELAAKAPAGDETTFNVKAYSPGKPDDPSTARRISLSRAMAVRAALIADGVQSARIFVRALGEQYGEGPPNRVDIDVTGPGSGDRR